VVDLPGTYSLSANSDEEIITREYIASGKADLVCVLADASQLERTLFMLADYAGIKIPVILLLNMMDVAAEQGKTIDSTAISKKLGIPVVTIMAADIKNYGSFFNALDNRGKDPTVLDETGILNLYLAVIGDTYRRVLALLPDKGIGAYSSAWLAAKLLEQDASAMEMVKSAVDANTAAQLDVVLSKVENGSLLTGDCKFRWIGELLGGSVATTKSNRPGLGRFDRIATSKTWGKPLAIVLILLGLVLSFIPAAPFMAVGKALPGILKPAIAGGLSAIGAPEVIISLICDAVINAVGFSIAMVGFVAGVSLVFGFLEEIGYMARISYAFDDTMAKLGLQGKAMMPFLVSFACTIGGAAGTRVIDSWGQRVLTISLAWAVPCAATWGVVGLMSGTFFGAWAPLVVISLFLAALLHMLITSKIFGKSLLKEADRSGLIMELPPYHKPKWKNLLRFVFNRMGDILARALKIIILVSVGFWCLSYTRDGDVSGSVIYAIGTFIEPATSFFGLGWQTFMAFVASAMGKEAALGVLSTLFASGSSVFSSAVGQGVVAADLNEVLLTGISRAEALAFIYAFTFNIPCLMAIASTYQETHSLKWTLRIAGYYIGMALLMALLAYRVGLMIF
jgi:ferrous iron transport protein B